MLITPPTPHPPKAHPHSGHPHNSPLPPPLLLPRARLQQGSLARALTPPTTRARDPAWKRAVQNGLLAAASDWLLHGIPDGSQGERPGLTWRCWLAARPPPLPSAPTHQPTRRCDFITHRVPTVALPIMTEFTFTCPLHIESSVVRWCLTAWGLAMASLCERAVLLGCSVSGSCASSWPEDGRPFPRCA